MSYRRQKGQALAKKNKPIIDSKPDLSLKFSIMSGLCLAKYNSVRHIFILTYD